MKKEKSIEKRYSFKDFLPLIIIGLLVVACALVRQFFLPAFDMYAFMNDFMGAFFIIFGLFKIMNLKGFAEAYSTYDIIAKRSAVYALIYPFLEIVLGVFYIMRWYPPFTNLVTLILMLVSAVGVAQNLAKREPIMCACLGTVFKIPMTYVTLVEDLLMALMAIINLIMLYT